jgi:dienelactone hydrolase
MNFWLWETPMKLVTSSVVLSLAAAVLSVFSFPICAQDRSLRENPELAAYFEAEVSKLEQQNELTRFKSLEEWQEAKPVLREQLFDMLGLSPRPAKTPLEPVIEGTVEEAEFVVERLHFQSLPGLYVTGNFYRPKVADKPLPTILYVCGHGQVKKDGVSFGNKTHYHYHGAWFARNGYNCLIIDTLQLGEIEGIHHGTYKMNRWWWNSRGYTPAGVEAWNCIRALDYLETRPEVDASKIGVSGRSGGGAYSWWISALDERIQCSVPVAGITNLRDHVVNGCVEGHCDCMFMVNTYRWDYATVAALVAPRPLLISNTDKDTIFPLEGVVDIHRQVRHIYQLHKAGDNLGLQITEGPHKDTQELHIHAFRWFNRFLRGDDSMIQKTADKFFQPEQLRVFGPNPTDEINTRIDEVFVPAANSISVAEVLKNQGEISTAAIATVRNRCFRAWPNEDDESAFSRIVTITQNSDKGATDGVTLTFESEPLVQLSMDIVSNKALEKLQSLELRVQLDQQPTDSAASEDVDAIAVMTPRGAGSAAWVGTDSKQIQIQRRFQLLGMTVDSMRVWDIRRAIQVVRQQCPNLKELRIRAASGTESLVLLASLFEPPVTSLFTPVLQPGPEQQPAILNLTRTLPLEMLPILAARRSDLLTSAPADHAPLAAEVTQSADWNGKRIVFGQQ